MARVSAYEMLGALVPPPEDTTEVELEETNCTNENGLYTVEGSMVSEEDARAAFIKYAQRRRRRGYGTTAARQCMIDSVRCVDAFHYLLETFTESRSTRFVEEPYQGQADVGGDDTTKMPEPWDIRIEPHILFEDDTATMIVQNSEEIKLCPNCQGACKVTCSFCAGAGSTTCMACTIEDPPPLPKEPQTEDDGEEVPAKMKEPCEECNGKGRKGCSPCSESGEKSCAKCEANGKIKCHVELIVQWKNNWDDFIVDYVGAIPEKVLRQLQGKVVVTEEKRKVSPISNFPNVDIIAASKELIESHQSEYSSQSKIIKQRHHVKVIPISDVKYTWKNKQLNFYIYGENKEHVYAPNYPQRCLCCCVM